MSIPPPQLYLLTLYCVNLSISSVPITLHYRGLISFERRGLRRQSREHSEGDVDWNPFAMAILRSRHDGAESLLGRSEAEAGNDWPESCYGVIAYL